MYRIPCAVKGYGPAGADCRGFCIVTTGTTTTTAHRLPPTLPQCAGDFLNILKSERLSKATLEAYSRDLHDFLSWCQEERIGSPTAITWTIIRHHLGHLFNRGLSNVSVKRHMAALKRFLRYLFNEGWISCDIAELLGLPKGETKIPRVLSVRNARRLVEGASAVINREPVRLLAVRDRAVMELLYATGCRASELIAIRLEDLNLADRVVRLLGKGSKDRLVPFGVPAAESVRRYLTELRPIHVAGKLCHTLFVTQTCRPLDRFTVWRIVRASARRMGLSAHPHTLRHCTATHMLEGGANLRVVQEVLGHADVGTTQRYTHISYKRLQEVHRRCHPRQ